MIRKSKFAFYAQINVAIKISVSFLMQFDYTIFGMIHNCGNIFGYDLSNPPNPNGTDLSIIVYRITLPERYVKEKSFITSGGNNEIFKHQG